MVEATLAQHLLPMAAPVIASENRNEDTFQMQSDDNRNLCGFGLPHNLVGT
jgi:hypothetical protein